MSLIIFVIAVFYYDNLIVYSPSALPSPLKMSLYCFTMKLAIFLWSDSTVLMVKMLRSWHDFIPISGLVLLTSMIWKGVSIALFFVLTDIVHTLMSGITLSPYVCKIALLFWIGGLFLVSLKIGNGMTLHYAPVSTLNSINWSLMLSLVNISFCAVVVLELLTWSINNSLMSI